MFCHTRYNTTWVYCIVATVSFKESEYSIFESDREPLKVVIVLSKLSSFNVTVQVMDTTNTATGMLLITLMTNQYSVVTGGEDYDSGPYNIIIPAGMLEASFDIALLDDDILEGDEDFTLVITSSSPPAGTISQATVTIVDDEGKIIIFFPLSNYIHAYV